MHPSILALFALIPLLAALPAPSPRSASQSKRIPLQHTAGHAKRYSPFLSERREWLRGQAAKVKSRYATESELRKRRESTIELQDVDYDSGYIGQISVGTPAQNFLVDLDTGSSDLWIVGPNCNSDECSGVASFDSSSSSTFKSSGRAFADSYGSGNVSGTIATDTVSLGGFTQAAQSFAVVNAISGNLIEAPQSGLLGLAWGALAEPNTTPFWLNLAQSGQESTAEFGFYLARYQDDQNASADEQQGGEFTLGGIDTSRTSSGINYIPAAKDYWRIPVQSVTSQGQQVAGVANRQAAIDTGTSIILAPTQDADAIYSNIPGAEALGGDLEGYIAFPCSETPQVALTFGGTSYSISAADFNLGAIDEEGDYCAGAIFGLDLGSNSISWVVGDTFLKNVYSVYRYNPPAVGFATLS